MIKKFLNYEPIVDPSSYIADSAVVIGRVRIGKNCSIWENAVIRGDIGEIVIGNNSNIQDNCTIHTGYNVNCIIGDNVTVGHNAIVHGAKIGNNVIVGMNSTVLDGAEVGDYVLIGANSLVGAGKKIDNRQIVVGNPIKVLRNATDDDLQNLSQNATLYSLLIEKYQ